MQDGGVSGEALRNAEKTSTPSPPPSICTSSLHRTTVSNLERVENRAGCVALVRAFGTRSRLSRYSCLCRRAEKEKKGRSIVCGTQKSDRAASPAPTPHEVRSGAVLPGSSGQEPRATGAVPQSTDNSHRGSYHLAEVRRKEENTPRKATIAAKMTSLVRSFSTPTPVRW